MWINEIHYDNAGTDTGEFVEIAGAAGTILDDWSLVGYNGATGAFYKIIELSGAILDQSKCGDRLGSFSASLEAEPPGASAPLDRSAHASRD